MFEQATRNKLRFETSAGLLSVEDLWDLPLTSKAGKVNLDEIARSIYNKVTDGAAISFVQENVTNSVEQDKLDIVKHIIEVRLNENREKAQAQAKKQQKELIDNIIAQKQNEELANMSIEELLKKRDSLG